MIEYAILAKRGIQKVACDLLNDIVRRKTLLGYQAPSPRPLPRSTEGEGVRAAAARAAQFASPTSSAYFRIFL